MASALVRVPKISAVNLVLGSRSFASFSYLAVGVEVVGAVYEGDGDGDSDSDGIGEGGFAILFGCGHGANLCEPGMAGRVGVDKSGPIWYAGAKN